MPNDVKAMEMKAREMLAAAYAPERFTVCNNEVPNGFINRRDQAALRAIVTAMEGASVEPFRKWLKHDGLCAIVGGYGYCTCGLDAVLAKSPSTIAGGEG